MKYFFGTRFLNNCLSRCALTRRTARIFIHFQLLWTWTVFMWLIAQAHASYWVTMSLSPVTIVATHSKHMPGILGRLTHGKLLGTENTMSLGGPRACSWTESWVRLHLSKIFYFVSKIFDVKCNNVHRMNIKKLFTGVQLSTNVEITMMMTMKLSIVEIWISCVSYQAFITCVPDWVLSSRSTPYVTTVLP